MTGRVDRIIHSGRAPDLRNASIRRSRLIAFLRRCPDVCRISMCSFWARSSRSSCSMIFLTASAPMPASNMRPYCSVRLRNSISVSVCMTLMSFSCCRALRAASLASSVSRATCSRSLASASSIPPVRSASDWSSRSCAAALASLTSVSSASTSAATALRSAVSAAFDVSPARAMTSPVGVKTTSERRRSCRLPSAQPRPAGRPWPAPRNGW